MYIKTIKLIGFQPLRVNCCEINQVIPKCQMDFLGKTCKKKIQIRKKTITTKFYMFEIV